MVLSDNDWTLEAEWWRYLSSSSDGDDKAGHRGAGQVDPPALSQQHHTLTTRPDHVIYLQSVHIS